MSSLPLTDTAKSIGSANAPSSQVTPEPCNSMHQKVDISSDAAIKLEVDYESDTSRFSQGEATVFNVKREHDVFKAETDDECDVDAIDSSTKRQRVHKSMGEGSNGIFTKQQFMTQSLFHLNSYVKAQKKSNKGFGLFLRAGVATPGFQAVDPALVHLTYEEIRDALIHDIGWTESNSGARQVAMWLKDATVGSFVIMRHEYGKCKLCPKRLKDDNNKYIGPVYVIGVITKKVMPGSQEEKHLAQEDLKEYPHHTYCRVDWKRMGRKADLSKSTQSYLNKICQPTLSWICKDSSKKYADEATAESIKQDLWDNASIHISSRDFSDVFDESLYWTDDDNDDDDDA